MDPISKGMPKSLMPVGRSRVFLDYVFDWLSHFNPKKVILSLYYKSDVFQSYIDKHNFNFELQYVIEPMPLGTGGAIRYVVEQSGISGPFGVINGDTYLRFDFKEMVNSFNNLGCAAMIGLSYVSNTERYGSVVFENNQALAFREKSSSIGPGWVNNGCYIFLPKIFERYTDTGRFSIEKDIFPVLCQKKQLHVFQTNGEFLDIGVPEDYYKFVNQFANAD